MTAICITINLFITVQDVGITVGEQDEVQTMAAKVMQKILK